MERFHNHRHPSPVPSPEKGEGRRSTELVYGRRPVWEALRAGRRRLYKLWVAPDQRGDVFDEILQKAREKGILIEAVTRERLDRMTQGHHQGVAAKASPMPYLELEEFLDKLGRSADALVLGMDEIQDPQNVGAILRSAAFFGINAVLVPRWRSAPVGETALRASAGAAEYVPLVRIHNVVQAIDRLKESAFEVIGADISELPIGRHHWAGRTALILGSEGQGLRRLVKEHCDKLLGIPARTPVGSLNVGSAAAIFIHEYYRSK